MNYTLELKKCVKIQFVQGRLEVLNPCMRSPGHSVLVSLRILIVGLF